MLILLDPIRSEVSSNSIGRRPWSAGSSPAHGFGRDKLIGRPSVVAGSSPVWITLYLTLIIVSMWW